ncbi:MAG: C4-dicarboxylate ABC transporter, partial [Deltaproteobacteria bacterium]
ITESNHGLLDYMIVSSSDFWLKLPEDIRTELEAIMNESVVFGNKIAAEKDTGDKQKIIDSKRSEIIYLTDAERNQWVEAMKPVWEQFEKEIGKELIDAAFQANM